MNTNDWIGFIGVSILLLAFFLNLSNKIHKDSYSYILMNIFGAGIACLASTLINYLPFVILEACWTVVSVIALIGAMKKKSV